MNECTIWIEDSNNSISIGERTSIEKDTEIAAIEGTNIQIGEDCMLSSGIRICTGDSHSMIDLQGNRTNPSKDIKIDNHVWIGTRSIINKGVHISKNSIVGCCAVVTKSFDDEGIAIAGNPAKSIKVNVNWKRERI